MSAKNKILKDLGSYYEVDVSTPKLKDAVMLIDKLDWIRLTALHSGRFGARCNGSNKYVQANIKGKHHYIHRMILGCKGEIDHVNGNGLDNRKSNLRSCLHSENMKNRKLNKNNKSGYKGVFWNKKTLKWQACIMCDGKRIHLGCFNDLLSAAKAYRYAEIDLYGRFASNQ
jgi:hypothetical protein